MALGPRLDQPLPYVYARTSKVTAIYKRSLNKGVELSGRLAKSTVMAIVGSWTAPDESLEPQRLGLRMDGQFVRADDLEPALGSSFSAGGARERQRSLASGVRRAGGESRSSRSLGKVPRRSASCRTTRPCGCPGRFRTLGDERFYERADGTWVRHKDVTLVQARSELPEFATGSAEVGRHQRHHRHPGRLRGQAAVCLRPWSASVETAWGDPGDHGIDGARDIPRDRKARHPSSQSERRPRARGRALVDEARERPVAHRVNHAMIASASSTPNGDIEVSPGGRRPSLPLGFTDRTERVARPRGRGRSRDADRQHPEVSAAA